MATKKDKDSLAESTAKFEDYFKEDLDAIEEELKKSKEYSGIIDKEIEKLSGPSLGANKGSTRYLIDIIENAVALQTQRQGLRKDKFQIKKAIMDYAQKFADDDNAAGSNAEALSDAINKLLEADKAKSLNENITEKSTTNLDLDNAIDDILGDKGD